MAMASPSLVLVPLPSSSMIALKSLVKNRKLSSSAYMERLSMFRRMNAISLISAAKVETLLSMLSFVPILANKLCRMGK